MFLDFEAAFYEWFVAQLTLVLRGRGAAQEADAQTVTAPLPGALATPAGLRQRNSAAFRRPGELTHSYRVAGRDWSLGDDPRSLPPLMPRKPQTPMPDMYTASPQPFASLATQNEITDFAQVNDETLELRRVTVFSKGLIPHAGEALVADFPCEDAVREKLWRRRGVRGSPFPAWGEWAFLQQEYPSEQHPYQGGMDDGGPYCAGIETRDWRELRVTDVMPLFVSDDDKLWIPDHRGVSNWLGTPFSMDIQLRVNAARVQVTDGATQTTHQLYDNAVETFYTAESNTVWGAATEFNQPIKHYRRDGNETVRQAVFERREHTFNLSGSGSSSKSGAFTVSAGQWLTLNSTPPWWRSPLYLGAVVDGDQASTDEVDVTFLDDGFRSYLASNLVHVRFFTTGDNPVGSRLVMDVLGDGDSGYRLKLNAPISVLHDMEVQAFSVAVPKSGSRTYFVTDDSSWEWEQFTLVQVHRSASTLIYRVIPAVAITFSRTLRLYEGADSTGPLLNEDTVTDAEAYSISTMSSEAFSFMSTGGLTAVGSGFVTGGAQEAVTFSETPSYGGDLPACTFLRNVDAPFGLEPARHYRFDGPVLLITIKPIPSDPTAGVQPGDYRNVPQWSLTAWDDTSRTITGWVNPLIYDGEHGTLHNPAALSEQLGSSWMGLTWSTRWYAADALLDADGQTIGLALLDDDNLSLLVSVDGAPVWSGSVFDLLPCGGENFHVSFPAEGGPSAWPPEGSRNDIYRVAPHYNYLHPSWPFPTALVGPFAVRARIADDQEGVNWRSGIPTPPVVATPIF